MFWLQENAVKFCSYRFSATDFVAFENALYLASSIHNLMFPHIQHSAGKM